jgi:hypothetical protein
MSAIMAVMIGLGLAKTGLGVASLVQNKKAREEARDLADIQRGDEQDSFNQKVKNEERNIALNESKLGFQKEQAEYTANLQREDMQRGQDAYTRGAMNAGLDKTTKSMVDDKQSKVNMMGKLKSGTKSSMLGV